MAYNIVKHRRGTTDEWLKTSVTPEDGELIVVDCPDGVRRCKVGNGISAFKDLPYLDSAIERVLLDKLSELEATLDAKIVTKDQAQKDSLIALESQLTIDIQDALKSAKTQIEQSTENLRTDVLTQLKTTADTLQDQILTESSELDTRINVLDTAMSKKIADMSSTLSTALATAKTELTTAATDYTDDRYADLKSQLDTERTLRTGADEQLHKKVDNLAVSLADTILPTLQATDEALANSLAEVKTSVDTNKAALDKELAEAVEKLDSDIENLDTTLTKKITDSDDATAKTFATQLDNAVKVLDQKVADAASGSKTDLSKAIEKVDTDLANKEQSLRAAIGQVVTDLSTVDTTLNTALTALEQRGVMFSENTNKELKNLKDNVTQLQTDLSDLTLQLDNASIATQNDIEAVSADLVAAGNKHARDMAFMLSEVSRVDSATTITDISILDTIVATIARVYSELAGRVNDDIKLLDKLCAVEILSENHLISAKTELQGDLEEVDTRLSEALDLHKQESSTSISALTEKVTTDIQSLNFNLLNTIDTLRTTVFARLDVDQASIESINAKIKTLSNSVDSQFFHTEQIIEQNRARAARETSAVSQRLDRVSRETNSKLDTVVAKIEAQSKRISGLMAMEQGSTSGDAELADIRVGYNGKHYTTAGDAVRAVGGDVQDLKASLADYIDSQAVNGLYYDTTGEVGLMQPYMLYLKADEEILEDTGVHIVSGGPGGGGGGAGGSELKLGYITTSPLVVTANDKAVLKFTFTGTDSSGDIVQQAASTWKVNGSVVEYGTVKDGENEFDVTKYLSVGTTKVLLVVTDDNGSVVTKSWSVQQIELATESNFNDKITYKANEELIFTYTPYGSIEKTAVFILDGEEFERVTLPADISGTEVKYIIPPMPHGSHLLEVYLEATINGNKVTSNHTFKDILFYNASQGTPVIGVALTNLKTKQYAPVSIVYTVYDPTTETPSVVIEVDNVRVSSGTLTANQNYNNTPTGVYSYSDAIVGQHVVKIICRDAEKIINVEVEALGINIAPITKGLAFDFNPAGRDNSDVENRLWSQGNVHLSVSDNFDWVNGGYIPNDPDGPCFCVKAGSRATIDYKLFADDAKKLGKEFKLVFKTKNVANPEAVFLTCVDNTTDKNHIGIKMGVHNAYIYGQSDSLELSYSEEDVIEFEFNISKNTEKVPMVMGYEDGVPSRPMVYDDTYKFNQQTPKDIIIGSDDCDVYIYRFKVYNTSLTTTEILNNFIADARTADEMISRYTRNQIYDENHKLTAESLAEKCPWLRVYKVSAKHFTNNKSDKVKGTTIKQIYKNGDPVLDNWTCYNAQHSGQGTSSNNYGAAGRNLDFIMNKDGAQFILGDDVTPASKITLTRNSVPVAYLNAKVNIASSNNLTNAMLANRYNAFNPYRRPFTERSGVKIENIKDTMEFFNCAIFIQETDPDISTHREFADNDWHFYAIGNIGDSKKTDNTRATDPDDPYECCVEIMDVGLPLSDFPADTMISAMGYTEDETTHERKYIWAKPENLDILYERIGGQYVKTSDTEINYNKTYYVDILVNDDFSEDYTYGWRYISDDEDEDVVNFCKQKWIDFYRFVTQSSDTEFKEHLSDYFVVDSALYYYLFTSRYCMVDNRAKNTFWHYSKTTDLDSEGEPIRKWDLCWDYDNDTSLGLNNYGKQVYRYGLEDIDRDEAGEEVFRESDSTFFCRIRELFGAELKAMYKDLESKNAWHAESFLNACDAWQNEFPEELWRIDIERKYLRTYTSSFINGKGDAQFLVNMCNGRMKYHRRQWERSQEQYMASKYQTIRSSSDEYHANFRVNRFDNASSLAVTPSYQFTLTPFSYIYLNVWYGDTSRTPYSVRAVPNVPTTVPCPTALEADIINIGNASAIRDFGDLSACYPKTVSIGNASRVKKLKLGNDTTGYDNTAFTTLTTGSNPLLEEIDIENISSLTQALNLTALTNLKKLFAYGTNVPSVTFATAGKMNEVELPAVNNITLRQLKYLTTAKFNLSSYDNVVDIIIEDCPNINAAEIFNKCNNLIKARLIGVDFGTVTFNAFRDKVFSLKGMLSTGEETDNAILEGKVRFDRLTGAQFDELQARYPKLQISYDYLESTVVFKDTDCTTTIHTGTTINAADYRNPVFYTDDATVEIPEGMIAAPVKASVPAFDYKFIGWSTTKNIIVSVEDTENILTDEVRRAYREDTVKRVEGNRELYPVFEAIRRSYLITFINPTAPEGERIMSQVFTLYGYDASQPDEEPRKLDSINPDLYEFAAWYPDPVNITGEMRCEAQFAVKDEEGIWFTVSLIDITNCVDHNGNVFDGYEIIDDTETLRTMSITKCNNKFNPIVRIPSEIKLVDEKAYTVIRIGGFSDHSGLELIEIPDTVKAISARGFFNCYSLAELTLPEYLEIIERSAFQSCSKIKKVFIPKTVVDIGESAFADMLALKTIEVDKDNPKYTVVDNCLIDKTTGMVLQGFAEFTIPQDGSITSLGQHCFSNSNIVEAVIPSDISIISNNAFSRCTKLEKVILTSDVQTLDATCFAWCPNLTDVVLPEGLINIRTYVFDACGLTDIEIPSTVENVLERSFGDMASLQNVTFKKRVVDGEIVPPYIQKHAFFNSGTAETPIVFNLPWAAGKTPDAPWGAVNAIIKYDYDPESEEQTNA